MSRLTLDLAHAALAAALACKAHVPGDMPDEHEDNTFGLPDGVPVRRKLRAFFRQQLQHVLATVGKWRGVGLPAHFPRMADYTDPMASAMTPIIGAYWDKAGKALNGRLGLDPDEWRVTDPNVHRAIQQQTLKFCAKANETTDLGVHAAAEAVRDRLAAGLIGEGQSIPELAKSIRGVFGRASKYRAETIARTEVARAVHAAGEMSAIESGVVSAKRIMLSANSCPICVAVAAKYPQVPLGGSFGTAGNDPDYSTIKYPPIHPRCRCSISYVLIDPTASPVPAFVPSAASGHPAAVAEPEPERPNKPRKPKPGEPEVPAAGHEGSRVPTPEEQQRRFPGHKIDPADVAAFVEHSAIKQPLYHATDYRVVESIYNDGIKMEALGGVYAKGFYVSTEHEKSYGNSLLTVALDIRNPFVGTIDEFNAKVRTFPEADRLGCHTIRERLIREGYDAVIIDWEKIYPDDPDMKGRKWVTIMKPETCRFSHIHVDETPQ